jgi:hypothetical protein
LKIDFLASQPDGFPLFTLFFQFFQSNLFPIIAHYLFFMACCIYAYSMMQIGGLNFKNGFSLIFSSKFVLLLFLHSGLVWGTFCSKFFNLDLNWIWHHGLAEQGLLFGYFQPSTMGVLLFMGFAFYSRNKIVPFIMLTTIAGIFHANYILLGGMVFVAFGISSPEAFRRNAVWLLFPLIAWGIYGAYSLISFTSNSPEFLKASRFYIKNNSHLDPLNWLKFSSFFQLSIILTGLWFSRKSGFGKFLAVLFTLTALASALVLISNNVFLINLAPWRMSVIFVPTCLVLTISNLPAFAFYQQWNWPKLFFAITIAILLSVLFYKCFGNGSDAFLLKWRWGTVIAILTTFGILSLPTFKTYHFSLILILLLLAGGVVQLLFEEKEIENLPETLALEKICNLKNRTALFLVPMNVRWFTLKTLAPSYVGNNVYFSPALPEWKRRQAWVKGFFENSMLLTKIQIQNEGITHLLCPVGTKLSTSVWTLQSRCGAMEIYHLNND